MSVLTVKLTGVKEAITALKNVPDSIQRKHMRIALNAAGGVIKTAAVARVPRRTGLLKEAMGVKVKQKATGDWYVTVGVKRGMKHGIRTTRSGTVRKMSKRTTSNLKFVPGGGQAKVVSPSRYLHLAEGGTRAHFVAVKNKRVLAGNGGIWGRRVAIRARPGRFMAAAALGAGAAAADKAAAKLREAVLSHATK